MRKRFHQGPGPSVSVSSDPGSGTHLGPQRACPLYPQVKQMLRSAPLTPSSSSKQIQSGERLHERREVGDKRTHWKPTGLNGDGGSQLHSTGPLRDSPRNSRKPCSPCSWTTAKGPICVQEHQTVHLTTAQVPPHALFTLC